MYYSLLNSKLKTTKFIPYILKNGFKIMYQVDRVLSGCMKYSIGFLKNKMPYMFFLNQNKEGTCNVKTKNK